METYFNLIRSLENYTPEDAHITSESEIAYISEKLHLNDMNGGDLQNLRDMVVLIYERNIDRARDKKRYDDYDFFRNAMMSITAVIDLYKLKQGQKI